MWPTSWAESCRIRATAHASSSGDGDVALSGDGLPAIATAPPAEFGGPGDRWSPETLLAAAVADCFVLGFRSEQLDRVLQFVQHSAELRGQRVAAAFLDALGVLDGSVLDLACFPIF